MEKEKRRIQKKEYYERNKERLRACSRKNHYENRERNITRNKEWYEKNKKEISVKRKIDYEKGKGKNKCRCGNLKWHTSKQCLECFYKNKKHNKYLEKPSKSGEAKS